MHELDREWLLARVFEARDRLEVLMLRTSSPDLLHQIREADAIAAALEAECHLVVEVTASLQERIAKQALLVDQLAADVEGVETG